MFYVPPGSASTLGHVFLAAVNQDTGASAFLSFGPANDHASPLSLLTGTPGTYSFAPDFDNSSSLTIRTNPEDAQHLIDAINQMESGKAPDFYLLSDNCTTELEDALHDLGLDFGENDPQMYWRDLYDNYSENAQENPFVGFLAAPHQPHTDYGNPRNYGGMNYTNLLFRLWFFSSQPTPSSSVTVQQGSGLADPCTATPKPAGCS